MHKWEHIDDTTSRLKVPNGWIYRIFSHPYGGEKEMGTVFVPEGNFHD